MLYFTAVILSVLMRTSVCLNDDSYELRNQYYAETTTSPPPPLPYSFHYKAGRYPGHVDRVQSESSDGAGFVQGSYSYIDPKFKIRTVHYTADEAGFHPILENYEDTQALPVDTEAVKAAKQRHFSLYQRLAEENSGAPEGIKTPKDTVSVANAKRKHLELYDKIAAEHEAINAQREPQRAPLQKGDYYVEK